MAVNANDMRDLVVKQLGPALILERERLEKIDCWYRWKHDDPHRPRNTSSHTTEYRELIARAQTPWLQLVVTAVAQNLYVDGYRPEKQSDNATAWQAWQANGMDARQIAVHRAALAYGYSFITVVPGTAPDGTPMPVVRGVDPSRMAAFYLDPAEDEWPAFALRADPAKINGSTGWRLRVYDDDKVWQFHADGTMSKVDYVTFDVHGMGVTPVTRFANMLDLRGRTDGEVEPLIPLAGRIDQTIFDRLVVQRFSSWIVRTIAGMAKPEDPEDGRAEKLRLKVEDILVAEDPDTKFGSLPASPLDGFIAAKDSDLHDLASVSQTPAHELTGQMVNLSAEALMAARDSANHKIAERKQVFGESHEQWLRLAAGVLGDDAGAMDVGAQVRWRDTEARSLAAAADALGKLASLLQVPVEALWEMIPGVTQQDVEQWKVAVAQPSALEALMAQLAAAQTAPPPPGGPGGAGG